MNADSSSNKGWLVVGAGTAINLCLGVLYSWSIIKGSLYAKPPAPSWGLTSFQAVLPYAVALAVFAIMMVPAGRAQDKLGPRLVASLGGALLGIGFIVASFAPKGVSGVPLLVIGFGVIGGTGIALGYASATPGAVKWFVPAKKGLITGIVVAGFGLASVYTAPTTEWLLGADFIPSMDPVNQTFLILGVAFLVLTVVFAQFIVNPPKGYVPAGTAPSPAAAPGAVQKKAEYEWHEMMKKPQFYLLWIMYAFVAFAGLMIIGHVGTIAKGIAETVATIGPFKITYMAVAILAVGNAIGRIVAGVLSDKIGRRWTMFLFFVSQAVFMGILYFTGSGLVWLMLFAAFGVGFNYGANLTLFPATTGDYFGVKNLGVNYGLIFTAWGAGGVAGTLSAGYIEDIFGSTANAYVIAGGLCILAALMTFALKPPKHADLEVPIEEEPVETTEQLASEAEV